jgi:hypothetical protein
MDRIRKALDLAREERARPFEVMTTMSLDLSEAKAFRLPALIEYTKTRTFEPLGGTARIQSHHVSRPTRRRPRRPFECCEPRCCSVWKSITGVARRVESRQGRRQNHDGHQFGH